MKYLLISILVASCSRQSFEMEELASDVLKSKTMEGIDIQVRPIPKEGK